MFNKYKIKADPNLKIDNIVTNDEKVVWKGKPIKKPFILNKILKLLPIALIWLAFDGAFIGLTASFWGEMPIIVKIILPIFFILHLLPVWICIGNIIFAVKQWKYSEYAITNKRIIIKSGLFAAGFTSIYYQEVKSLSVHVGLIDKWCHVGDILITTSTNTSSSGIIDISDYYDVYQKLEKLTRDVSTDISFPNAYRPENNPGYKTETK